MWKKAPTHILDSIEERLRIATLEKYCAMPSLRGIEDMTEVWAYLGLERFESFLAPTVPNYQ
jgi:hypothetical protein